MRPATLTALAVVTMISLITPAPAGQAEDEAAIRATVQGIYDGFNRHDARAIAALCDSDLETWRTGRRGAGAVADWIAEMVPGAGAGTAREIEELGISFLTSDVAIQKSRRELKAADSTEPPQTQLFLRVFVKRDGRWLLRGFFPAPEDDAG